MHTNFTDQLGNGFDIQSVPKRVVSLVPSQTELLCDLGLEEHIIGITKFCVHPYHLKSVKKIIGGTKKVHYEKIKLLQPDLIIANKEENTLEIVEELRKICPVWVTNVITFEDNIQMISDFGKIFKHRTEAQKWIDKINFAYTDFKTFVAEKPTQKATYFIWKNPYMVAGSDNFINEMLKLNHFKNIYDDKGRYPEIELKKMRIEGDPDLVFLSSEPFPFKEEDAFEIGRFTHHAKTVFVDGEMFSWYGSRILKAFAYFKKLHERIG
ncbi:iron ABC transporter [Flavobacterium noncentrifugens]|uniref:ABC-type Fe3+-hydroxamate transport system, substrate-binding protein n=1 Tax=Flavobacterium noncentrifugens TaxID=1128970 RepID=A0A1G8YYA5_9FLAO|nr:helical backbone metal receptor [Flavobacterium noncentrifugens]GEP51405.1 iron ABC transporter [Flavobacterium noncentrifugens]SDK07761.1 ABC-type Fe3+-hydroxamate transport system, substrate-binding protein [Flavobacterium noncentrifugens]